MEKENYIQIFALEKENWWYRARRDLLDKILASLNTNGGITLDAGCGVGTNFEILSKYSKSVYGVDISKAAVTYCAHKGYEKLIESSIAGFESSIKFDLIVCMDVLEHVDDSRAVISLMSHLACDGIMALAVPAHRYLWNMNDTFSHHLRRYEIGEIRNLITEHGLRVIRLSYWNQFMLIPSLLYCALIKIVSRYVDLKPQNNLNVIPGFLNSFLYYLLKIENMLFMRFGLINGVSIICVCKKDD